MISSQLVARVPQRAPRDGHQCSGFYVKKATLRTPSEARPGTGHTKNNSSVQLSEARRYSSRGRESRAERTQRIRGISPHDPLLLHLCCLCVSLAKRIYHRHHRARKLIADLVGWIKQVMELQDAASCTAWDSKLVRQGLTRTFACWLTVRSVSSQLDDYS